MCTGPNYETPADTLWLRTKCNVGSFGMSTVPELLGGHMYGMEGLAISLVTNLCAGLQSKLTHSEIAVAADEAGPRMQNLFERMISKIDSNRNK